MKTLVITHKFFFPNNQKLKYLYCFYFYSLWQWYEMSLNEKNEDLYNWFKLNKVRLRYLFLISFTSQKQLVKITSNLIMLFKKQVVALNNKGGREKTFVSRKLCNLLYDNNYYGNISISNKFDRL